MSAAQSIIAALKSDRFYRKEDNHIAAYSGSRVEMTYRDGRVVVTLTSYSLSSPSNIEVVTHELTPEGFEDWLASRPQWEQDNMLSFAQQKD